MKFNDHGSGRDDVELNLSPLIDVVLVLIIFFVVTTTFARRTQLHVNLPRATSGQASTSRLPSVSVDARGDYAVGGHRLATSNEQTLIRALKRLVPDAARRDSLVIRADGRASHQSVITVMDAAARLGFGHIAMAAQQRP